MPTTDQTCRYCDSAVTSTNPEVDFCRDCFYIGHWVPDVPRFSDVLAELWNLPNTKSADVWHTGGGCFGIAIQLAGDRFIFATAAENWADDGEEPNWQPGAVLPYDDEPWGIGIYANDGDAFMYGQGTMVAPLTDKELVEWVRVTT